MSKPHRHNVEVHAMTNTRRFFLILVALFVAVPLGWVGEIQAQQTQPGGPPEAPSAGGGAQPGAPTPGGGAATPESPASGQTREIEGKIKAVDATGSKLTLEDGTLLMIPPTVNVPKASLKEGALVKASFEEKGGQKVVTHLEVKEQ
jgi:Cu/Ag efflux protein CusF